MTAAASPWPCLVTPPSSEPHGRTVTPPASTAMARTTAPPTPAQPTCSPAAVPLGPSRPISKPATPSRVTNSATPWPSPVTPPSSEPTARTATPPASTAMARTTAPVTPAQPMSSPAVAPLGPSRPISKPATPGRLTSLASPWPCPVTPPSSEPMGRTATPPASTAMARTTAPVTPAQPMFSPAAVPLGPSRPISKPATPGRMTSLASPWPCPVTPPSSGHSRSPATPPASMAMARTTAPPNLARLTCSPAAVPRGPSRPISKPATPSSVTTSAGPWPCPVTPLLSEPLGSPATPPASTAMARTTVPTISARSMCSPAAVPLGLSRPISKPATHWRIISSAAPWPCLVTPWSSGPMWGNPVVSMTHRPAMSSSPPAAVLLGPRRPI